MQQLLNSITGQTWVDAWDRAIISMLFRTGLRRGEIAGLQVRDLNFEQRRLAIHAQASKRGADAILAMRRRGWNSCWVLMWYTSENDYFRDAEL